MLKYKKLILLFVFSFMALNSFAKKIKGKNALKVSYYNLENLYDTIPNSERKLDADYTPDGNKNWNTEKYVIKINNCALAIRSLHDSTKADIIGLSGVENVEVLKDLIQHNSLIQSEYAFVFMKGEKGETGLGMAFLYNPKKLELIWDSSFNLSGKLKPGQIPIKDGMHAKFKAKKIVLDFVMVDLPNPFENSLENRKTQNFVAGNSLVAYLNNKKLLNAPTTIIIGSIHSTPRSIVPLLILKGEHPDSMNYMHARFASLPMFLNPDSVGTYYQERVPLLLDQALLAKQLYSNRTGWQYLPNSYSVHNPIWLRHPYPVKVGHPFNNFFNQKWIGGYSSYYPISFTLVYAKKRKKVN